MFVQWPGSQNNESETDAFYNTYGLPTELDEYDYGNNTPGSLLRKTVISYASLGNDIQDRPSQVQVEDAGSNVKAQTTYSYDQSALTATSGTPQHVSVSGSRGNLTTVSQLVNGSATLTKTFTYFDTGNVYQGTDVNGAVTTYTYGACGNSFQTQVSLPLSLSTSETWDCNGGLPTSTTDANSQPTVISYGSDPFWRPIQITDPESNIVNSSYTPNSSESWMNFGTSTVDILTTFDGLGRKVLTQKREGPGSSNFDTVQDSYDSNGRLASVSQPCVATAGNSCTGATTTTTYDAVNRPLVVTDGGGGTISYTYAANDVLQVVGPAPSGEHTKQKQSEYDALGRLTSVCEITSASGSGTCSQTSTATGYWTEYTYDLLNDLTGVTQNAQGGSTQTRTYVYDMLGRMTSEANPENGTTNYAYDSDTTCTGGYPAGNLIKRTDAIGNVTCSQYDQLHRPLNVTYPSGSYSASTDKKYYVYDAATVNGISMPNAKGRLAEAYTCPPTGSCSTKKTDLGFGYSVRGEVTDTYESTPHSSGYYHAAVAFWPNGGPETLSGSITGLPTISYGVDAEGRTSIVSASSGQNPVTASTYNPDSQVTALTLGSADNDAFTFDPNTGRMTKYQYNVGTGPQSVIGNLTWNANGTLKTLAITDPLNSANAQTCNYVHDDLARTSSVNCGTPWSQTFGLDPFGNLTKSGTSSFLPTYNSATNRYSAIPGGTPTYDADGNLTYDVTRSYTWDAEGKPISVNSTAYVYDAFGREVEGNSSAQVVYGPSGGKLAVMSGSTLTKAFIPLPGGGQAVYNSSGLQYYRHPDWLGSSRLATTPTRTKYFDVAYAPYGEDYADSGTTDLSYAGHDQTMVAGLYDSWYREYPAIQGRWVSPDPAGSSAANPADPQTWNRYAYVRGNPLEAEDSTGLQFQQCIKCAENGGGMLSVYGGSSSDADIDMAGYPTNPLNVVLSLSAIADGGATFSSPDYSVGWTPVTFTVQTAVITASIYGQAINQGVTNYADLALAATDLADSTGISFSELSGIGVSATGPGRSAANNSTPKTATPAQQQCSSIQQARADALHTQRNKNLLRLGAAFTIAGGVCVATGGSGCLLIAFGGLDALGADMWLNDNFGYDAINQTYDAQARAAGCPQ